MSQTIVARLSRIVDRNASRRGFLSRSVLGATAMVVAPAAYALRPTTAHAAICGCSGSNCGCSDACCDGYTDFCCQMTGENLCPPGTLVAGWWKADGSGFCDLGGAPQPRYYLDCNRVCDDGCGCGASGICATECTDANCRCLEGCGSQSVDCTRFRYGQCNQNVECVGEIACRVVTCVPPWEWDPTCTNTSATDNQTAFHDRPCLHDGFTDVAPDAFYTEAVGWMAAEGITTGLTNDLFGPREPAPRSHFATFLWRYAGRPDAPADSGFVDVSPDEWYAQPVSWMVGHGLTTGIGDNRFGPDMILPRSQAITFLWRLAGSPSARVAHNFSDVSSSDYFDVPVGWAAENGVTTGVSPTLFAPTQPLTRAQAATFLHRFHMLFHDTLALPGATP